MEELIKDLQNTLDKLLEQYETANRFSKYYIADKIDIYGKFIDDLKKIKQ